MKWQALAALSACVVLAACGSTATANSSTTTHGSTAAAVIAGPKRIVSMSPTATEMLFAIGAGPQVVAVDDQSDYPTNAPKTKLSAYEPNAEAIAKYTPDLVVVSEDTKNLKRQLTTLRIPVLVQPAATALDDSYREITELGAKTGHSENANRVVTSMRDQIGRLAHSVSLRTTALTYYHELDNTLYSVTSKTFIGQLYALAGLRDVADPADKASGGYPQLSAEYLVKANPDLVFLADTKCCAQTAATFGARPGFGALAAVHHHHVVLLDDDVASRWGPRVVDFLRQIIQAVAAIPAT